MRLSSSLVVAYVLSALLLVMSSGLAAELSADDVLQGLRSFYSKTARPDGSFQPGIDPEYRGMSDSAFSDLAAVTYAVTLHKTFGWELPHEKKTIEWLLARQRENGDFFNVAGTVEPDSPQGRVYNTTQALVALHALGVEPKYDPLPVFEKILKQDYKTLPAYSTSFFPLAYLCAGKPIPEQADQAIRALMVPDAEGYLNNHVAATYHSSHYYALVGEPTPKGAQMARRVMREQAADGSWLLNPFSRDRHATFDAVFVLKHEVPEDKKAREAIRHAADWALSCRNEDGGFGHFPGSTSDADANYFQIGTLVMAGVLTPTKELPTNPALLSWGHVMPARRNRDGERRIEASGWVGGLAFNPNSEELAVGASDGSITLHSIKAQAPSRTINVSKRPITSLAFTADRKSLIAGTLESALLVRDVGMPDPAWIQLSGHRGSIASVATRDDLLATAGTDGTVRLWTNMGKNERTMKGHKSWVNSIAFLDDETLISGSSDGTVQLWDVTTGEQRRSIDATKAEVRSVAASPDGRWIAAGIRYGVVKLWDTEDWRETVLEHEADEVWSVAFSTDSKHLFVAPGRWNRATDVLMYEVGTKRVARSFRHTGEVVSLAVSPNGTWLAAGGMDEAVSLWKLK